jgi:cytoskeleton protein RodZ
MAVIGPELKQIREKRGISLLEISASTKVGRRLLEALEQDRLDLFPGAFFAKGIIRTYARAVGLDEHDIVDRYMKAGLLVEADPPRSIVLAPPPRRIRRALYAGLAVLVVAALTFALYSLIKSGKSPAAPAPSSVAPTVVPEPRASEPVTSAAPPPASGLAFEFAVTAPTWIQVYADGELKVDGIKLAGARFQVRAEKELVLHLGNAGGLTAALNGKPLKSFGRYGAVVKDIRVTAENAEGFLAPDPAKGN